jgi:membrane complex biogenesis BtpA family protein
VTHALVEAANRLPVGIEILLNDPEASLAVAHAAGADFIRTDYFADEMRRPEHGVMRVAPGEVIAYRERIGARHVLVMADIQVKYAQLVAPRSLGESARDAREQGADAILVTGTRTGEPPSPEDVLAAREGAGDCPVLVGSGLAPGNARGLLEVADGAIVGTSLMRDGRAAFEQIAALMSARP